MRLIERKIHAKSRTPAAAFSVGLDSCVISSHAWMTSSTVIVALAGYGEAIRCGVAALVDVLQLAGIAANAMPPAEVATSWLAPV
jgi:hypothetical protein